jgi:uncharacterized protein (UPF0276 family)
LRRLAGLPIIAHGLSSNAASFGGPDLTYLNHIKHLVDGIDAIVYSDHLALTAVAGRELGHLAPNLFDDELLVAADRNIRRIVEVTGRRVCLENLATKTMISGSTYTPEEFYLAMLGVNDQWDGLVDLTNVWINSQNRPVDPEAFIDAIPPERIGYIHLAGGTWLHGELVDTHSQAVHPEVFELLDRVLQRATPTAVIIERDSNWESAEDELRADVERARALVDTYQPAVGTPPAVGTLVTAAAGAAPR